MFAVYHKINIYMNYDKIKKIVDLSQWENTPIEEIPKWELRDILSHSDYLNLDEKESQLVENIVANQPFFSWRKENLSIFGEARVQQLLREHGYDLFCADLNEFPSSSKELRQYISKHSLRRQIKFGSKSLVRSVKEKLHKSLILIYSFLGFHSNSHFSLITMIMAMSYAIYSNIDLLAYALIAAYVTSNCMAMVIHEYWVHDQLRPKNRIIGFIFDYLGLMFFGSRLTWKYRHNYHHIHWKNEKDVETSMMLKDHWLYYLFSRNKGQYYQENSDNKDLKKVYDDAVDYYFRMRNQLPIESQFLDNNVIPITILSNLIFLLLLGPIIYIYFVYFQTWVFQKYIPGFNELVTHYNNKTREQESDTPYLFPICCGTAYHKTHHTYITKLVLGPGWVKYFNVQYYFVKLFYKLKPGISMT